MIPILLNLKQTFGGVERGLYRDMSRDTWQFAFGLGVFRADDPIPDMGLDDGTSFAWQVMFDCQFDRSWFLEGRYIAGEDISDDALFGLEVGYRF